MGRVSKSNGTIVIVDYTVRATNARHSPDDKFKSSRVLPVIKVNVMADTTITFKLLGLTCTMCALTLEKQLSDQGGVTSANVNFALGNSTVTYDPNSIGPKQLTQPIREVGYDADIERVELEVAGIVCVACITPSKTHLRKSWV